MSVLLKGLLLPGENSIAVKTIIVIIIIIIIIIINTPVFPENSLKKRRFTVISQKI